MTAVAQPSPLPRELLGVLLALFVGISVITGCATRGLPSASPSPPGPSGGAPSSESTSVVLLRLRQTQHGVPAVQRQALWPWIANIVEQYCAADGFALVASDLGSLLERVVRELLALHGIGP